MVVADINEAGPRRGGCGGHFVATDVSDLDANRAMVEYAQRAAAASTSSTSTPASPDGSAARLDLAAYRRAMSVNLDGVVFGTTLRCRRCAASRSGAIVATASLAELTGVAMDRSTGQQARRHRLHADGPALAARGSASMRSAPASPSPRSSSRSRDKLAASVVLVIPAEQVADA